MTLPGTTFAPLRADISGERIVLTYEPHHVPRIRAIPGAKFDETLGTEGRWTVPATWAAAVALYKDFPDMEVSADMNAWGFRIRDELIGPAKALRSRMDLNGLDTSKTDRSTRIAVDVSEYAAWSRDNGRRLYRYQPVGAAFLAVVKQGMLLDDMGVGKTVSTITALRILQHIGETPFPALVIAPSSVKNVWAQHFATWYPELKVVNVKGSIAERRKALETPAAVYIMSYNIVQKHSKLKHYPGAPARRKCTECGGKLPEITPDKCQSHERELNRIPFKTVICDEAQRLISPKAHWTQAIWSVSDDVEFRFALTGTPIQDNVEDFWSLLRFIRPTEFPAKTQFVDRYGVTEYSPWGTSKVIGVKPERVPELDAVTQPYWRRILKSVALPFLPPVYTEERVIPMIGLQAKGYRDMARSMIAELEDNTGAVVATTPLTRGTRLMQFSSSYATLEPPDDPTDPPEVKLHLPSNKITAFLEDYKAGDFTLNDAGTIVFAKSKQLLDMLSQEMKTHDIDHFLLTGATSEDDRNAMVDDFEAGKVKCILITIDAGGAGLTLAKADTMVFLQRSWSSLATQQALARAHRIGSEQHTRIRVIHYLSEGTVERKQLQALAMKGERAEEILHDREALVRWLKDPDS